MPARWRQPERMTDDRRTCRRIRTSAHPDCRVHCCRRHRTDRSAQPALRSRNTSDAPLAERSFESHATIASHISIALSPPRRRKNLPGSWPGKTGQEKACHVGQITCICSSSQELSPRRETGRGLFESDGDPHSRAHSPPCQRIAARRVPVGSSSEPVSRRVRAARWRPSTTTNHHEEASMTAYLISLSLAGLIAIAVWEALS